LKYPEGPERLAAVIYWMQYLDYFHWPGVRHFTSLPDLMYGLVHDDLAAASREMKRFVARQRRLSVAFWQDAMARLLTGSRLALNASQMSPR